MTPDIIIGYALNVVMIACLILSIGSFTRLCIRNLIRVVCRRNGVINYQLKTRAGTEYVGWARDIIVLYGLCRSLRWHQGGVSSEYRLEWSEYRFGWVHDAFSIMIIYRTTQPVQINARDVSIQEHVSDTSDRVAAHQNYVDMRTLSTENAQRIGAAWAQNTINTGNIGGNICGVAGVLSEMVRQASESGQQTMYLANELNPQDDLRRIRRIQEEQNRDHSNSIGLDQQHRSNLNRFGAMVSNNTRLTTFDFVGTGDTTTPMRTQHRRLTRVRVSPVDVVVYLWDVGILSQSQYIELNQLLHQEETDYPVRRKYCVVKPLKKV